MQDKAPKSQLIRLNNLANKKARRRLIGSIFLLIVALLILFHISSKIKPVQIKPESIEIKTHNKQISSEVLAANPIIVESRAATYNRMNSESRSSSNNSIAIANKSASQTLKKAAASSNTHKSINVNSSAPAKSSATTDLINDTLTDTEGKSEASAAAKPVNLHITPTIAIEQASLPKPTPEEILNGNLPEKPHPKYFVQLMASSDKAKLTAAKNKLAHIGISSSIQSTKHGSNTIYRLRIGPFNDKSKAHGKLAEVQNKLNN